VRGERPSDEWSKEAGSEEERESRKRDVQEREAAKKTKTSSSESFNIRGSWEGISDAPTMEMERRLREVVKGVDWWSRKENKRNGRYNMGTDGRVNDVLLLRG
jgi:hypothetical protein